MMLGKRPRHAIKRTTSMTEFALDLNSTPAEAVARSEGLELHMLTPSLSLSPRNFKRNFSVETSEFLRSCSHCKTRLFSGRDIFMYRGDTAFCSSECRERRIKHDEMKKKCSLEASKKRSAAASTTKVSA